MNSMALAKRFPYGIASFHAAKRESLLLFSQSALAKRSNSLYIARSHVDILLIKAIAFLRFGSDAKAGEVGLSLPLV